MSSSGVIQSASDSVEKVFGWTPTELYGRNLSELVPEPRRTDLDRYLDRYRRPGPPKALQRAHRFDALRKDGSSIQIELSLSRADIPTLTSSYFVGIVRDVTHLIDIDTDPMVERSQLHQLVTEQTRALAKAHLRLLLADRLASLGTLSAGLGHDMNNVLLPVRARLNALEHSGLDEAALKHVAVVRTAVVYLQHLSDGLHFLAPQADVPNTAHHELDVTDLQSWWNQVGTLMQLAIPTVISFSSSFAPGLPPVTIAAHLLTQAVLNFIVNAGEAIPKGRRKPFVKISAAPSADGKHVELSVADNGRGMTQAVSRRAFDLFFTTKTRSLGTGLGLPLARKVISNAGGTIIIHSRLGQGTTLVVTLPISPLTTPRRSTTSISRTPGPLSATVTVATPRLAALYAQVLLAAGMHVRGIGTKAKVPGDVNVWITDPSSNTIAVATRWCKKHPGCTIVCVGAPPANQADRWRSLGAVIIDPPDNYETIRNTVLRIASTHSAGSKPARRRNAKETEA